MILSLFVVYMYFFYWKLLIHLCLNMGDADKEFVSGVTKPEECRFFAWINPSVWMSKESNFRSVVKSKNASSGVSQK